MENIKLIVSDMDGTLLDHNGQLDYKFFELFKVMSDKGIKFAVASGRQYYSLIELFGSISSDIYFLSDNGASIIKGGKDILRHYIDKFKIEQLIQISRKIDGAQLVICGRDYAYTDNEILEINPELNKHFKLRKKVNDLMDVNDEIVKVSICHPDGAEYNVLPLIKSIFEDELQVVVSSDIWVDIMNKDVTKGSSLKFLQSKYSIGYDNTLCFGDYFNDIEMFSQCKYSYAMENAHPEVKKYAKFIAPSNKDYGVISVLDELLSN
ncbi:TPA: Cof-type HAD-IIB family hydrolase [Vibrio cholerae]